MQYRRRHDRHLPRGWFSLFVRFGGWVSFIFGVLLVALTAFSASSLYLADRMDSDGRYARAAVLDKRVVISTDSDGDEVRDYFVGFAFKTSDGGARAEAKVSRAFYERAKPDDEHVIRYLRADPSQIEYDPGSYRRSGALLRNIGLAMGLVGLGALWFFGGQANRAIKARRDGEKRFAVITEIREINVEVNDVTQGRLHWRETDGKTGQTLMHDMPKLLNLYDAGDRIVVFRLGSDAFWEGDVGPPKREIDPSM